MSHTHVCGSDILGSVGERSFRRRALQSFNFMRHSDMFVSASFSSLAVFITVVSSAASEPELASFTSFDVC